MFLIAAFQETTFNKSTFDLRDKTLLKFERDKVDGVDVDRRRQDADDRQGRRRLEDHASRSQARADFGPSKGWSAGCRRRR